MKKHAFWAGGVVVILLHLATLVTTHRGVLDIQPLVLGFKAKRQAQKMTLTCSQPFDLDAPLTYVCLSLQRKGPEDNGFRVISESCRTHQRNASNSNRSSSDPDTQKVLVSKDFQEDYFADDQRYHGMITVWKKATCTESQFTYRCTVHLLTFDSKDPQSVIQYTHTQEGAVRVLALPTPAITLFPDTTELKNGDPLMLHCQALHDFADGNKEGDTRKENVSESGSKAVTTLWWQRQDVRGRGDWLDVNQPTSATISQTTTHSCWTVFASTLSILHLTSSSRYRCLVVVNDNDTAAVVGKVSRDVIVDGVTLDAGKRSFIRFPGNMAAGQGGNLTGGVRPSVTASGLTTVLYVCVAVVAMLGLVIFLLMTNQHSTTAVLQRQRDGLPANKKRSSLTKGAFLAAELSRKSHASAEGGTSRNATKASTVVGKGYNLDTDDEGDSGASISTTNSRQTPHPKESDQRSKEKSLISLVKKGASITINLTKPDSTEAYPIAESVISFGPQDVHKAGDAKEDNSSEFMKKELSFADSSHLESVISNMDRLKPSRKNVGKSEDFKEMGEYYGERSDYSKDVSVYTEYNLGGEKERSREREEDSDKTEDEKEIGEYFPEGSDVSDNDQGSRKMLPGGGNAQIPESGASQGLQAAQTVGDPPVAGTIADDFMKAFDNG